MTKPPGGKRTIRSLYAAIVAGIREKSDAIVYPTLPADENSEIAGTKGAADRFAALKGLADRGLCEWGALDPGSMNFVA